MERKLIAALLRLRPQHCVPPAREVTTMVRIISALILAVTAACASATEPLTLVDNPPDRHIVVKGDTLWGISGKFLKQPWRWPEIWQMNRSSEAIIMGNFVFMALFLGVKSILPGYSFQDKGTFCAKLN